MRRLAYLAWAAALLAGCTDKIVYENDNPWADTTDYPPIGDGKILVTNSGDDGLTWVDLDTLQPVFEDVVGFYPPEREGPHHGAAMPDGSAFFIGLSNYVPGSGSGPHGSHGSGTVDGYLLEYDPVTHRLLGDVRVDRNPGDVRITHDGTRVLQSHFDLQKIQDFLMGTATTMNSRLAIVDTATLARQFVEVCPAMHGIGIAADDSEAYITCYASDELAVVSLDDAHTVERFPVGPGVNDPTLPSYQPYAATVSPADGTVWVSCLKTGDVRVFDPATRTWDTTRGPVVTGGAPFFGTFTAAGDRLYVPHQGDNALAIIDGTSGALLQTVQLPMEACQAPHGVLLTPDEQKLLVVCEGDHLGPGTVAVLRLEPAAVEDFFQVGVFPDDLILLRQP